MSPRLGWVDVAKGLCIVLVVLWHVLTKDLAAGDWGPGQDAIDAWATLSALLLPLRMPLFFTISGLLAARALAEDPPGTVWIRAARWGSLYVVWVLIQTAVFRLLPGFDTAQAHSWGELLAELTIQPTNLWYLFALTLYIVVARLTRNLPVGLVLGAAAALSGVASMGILPDSENLWQVLQNLVFFLAAVRLAHVVRALAAAASVPVLLGAGVAFACATVVVGLFDARHWPGVWVLLCSLAVTAGLALCALIDQHLAACAVLLSCLGRRTLPIYVLHMLVLAVFQTAGPGFAGLLRASGSCACTSCAGAAGILTEIPDAVVVALSAIAPLVLTAAAILCCLGVHRVMLWARLGALFDPLLVHAALAGRRGTMRRS
ncbi:putative membrane protein YcfT [Leucobacter luti]|uniref:Putative membrane protein YcfT n=1 Tax=Leucobacter luti TaxID=340320 RepID=A0A4R6RW32_9MICO|nr:acyltransferase family protein [Leucobacter luti]TDP90346.1 putative membrane protein YcfT [Leucobacter luti]